MIGRIGRYLRRELADAINLKLDINANAPVKRYKVLGKKNVVGELYHGNSHTTGPKWIKEFHGRGYTILTVVLNASLETHIKRLAKRPDKRCRKEVEYHYKKFHNELKSIFSALAGIKIKTSDEKEINQIGDEVLGYLGKGASAPIKVM